MHPLSPPPPSQKNVNHFSALMCPPLVRGQWLAVFKGAFTPLSRFSCHQQMRGTLQFLQMLPCMLETDPLQLPDDLLSSYLTCRKTVGKKSVLRFLIDDFHFFLITWPVTQDLNKSLGARRGSALFHVRVASTSIFLMEDSRSNPSSGQEIYAGSLGVACSSSFWFNLCPVLCGCDAVQQVATGLWST